MENKNFSEISFAKKVLRILLSPIVFLWGVIIVCAGCIFPIPLIMLMSGIGLIAMPFKWMLKNSGVEVEEECTLITSSRFNSINHFFGITIFFWGAFAIVYIYVVNGVFFTGE